MIKYNVIGVIIAKYFLKKACMDLYIIIQKKKIKQNKKLVAS